MPALVAPKFRKDILLVVGSEGQGISSEVASACDKSVRIPIAPAMESLNAAVAASVLMWHYRIGR